MNTSALTVLLVTDGARNAPVLQRHLQTRGCDVSFASSYREAAEMLSTRQFRLVLGEFILSDRTAYRLMPLLRGTGTTLFFSDAMEDGYWWMLALYQGQDRWGEPGMRATQFRTFLDELFVKTDFLGDHEGEGQRPIENSRDLAVNGSNSGTPSRPTGGALPRCANSRIPESEKEQCHAKHQF